MHRSIKHHGIQYLEKIFTVNNQYTLFWGLGRKCGDILLGVRWTICHYMSIVKQLGKIHACVIMWYLLWTHDYEANVDSTLTKK